MFYGAGSGAVLIDGFLSVIPAYSNFDRGKKIAVDLKYFVFYYSYNYKFKLSILGGIYLQNSEKQLIRNISKYLVSDIVLILCKRMIETTQSFLTLLCLSAVFIELAVDVFADKKHYIVVGAFLKVFTLNI